MRGNKKISLVIPTLNEARNLPKLLNQIPFYIDEVIIVDGYSKDNTVEIAKHFGCQIYFDKKGKGSALKKGTKLATGDIIVMMDADWSHRVKEMDLMIAGIETGYDICMGSRFMQGGGSSDITFLRRLGNKFFVSLVNFFYRMNYSDLCYGYRAFRKEAFEKLNLKSNGFAIETEISIRAAKKKLRVLEVPSFEKSRKHGKAKLKTFSDGWKIFNIIIREVFWR
jgi:glycosyltransferase involved in cell wall biosynthesis